MSPNEHYRFFFFYASNVDAQPLYFFQVYAWGCGACLGCGSSEATALRPKLIEELAATRIVDISIGDSHCLALSHGTIMYNAIFLTFITKSLRLFTWLHMASPRNPHEICMYSEQKMLRINGHVY